MRRACRGKGPLQLAADRRGREKDDRRRGEGAERGAQGSRGPGRRALLPLEGLAARALDAVARDEGRAAAPGRKEACQDRDRPGARRAVTHQVALSASRNKKEPAERGLFLVGSSITRGGFKRCSGAGNSARLCPIA